MSNTYHSEMTVLSVLLQQGQEYEKLTLEPKHFLNKEHRLIYEVVGQLYEKNAPIDFEMVSSELGKRVTEIGGVSYLLELEDYAPSIRGLENYEQNVFKSYRDKVDHELLVKYNKERSDKNRLKLIQELEQNHAVGIKDERKSTKEHYYEIGSRILDGKTELETGYKTGLIGLDNMTGGFQRGHLIVIGARPGMGKTALSLHIADELTKDEGVAHIMTYEMTPKELMQRLISKNAYVDNDVWLQNHFGIEDYKKAMKEIGPLSERDLEVYEYIHKVREMKNIMRNAIKEKPNQKHMLIIDGIKYIDGEKNHQNRTQEVGEITRALKLMAGELNIPIILVSQLNRGVENRDDKRPFMSDLKDSGSLEEDADVIMFLYRDAYYNDDTEFPNIVELKLEKNRHGGKGNVILGFTAKYGLFSN